MHKTTSLKTKRTSATEAVGTVSGITPAAPDEVRVKSVIEPSAATTAVTTGLSESKASCSLKFSHRSSNLTDCGSKMHPGGGGAA